MTTYLCIAHMEGPPAHDVDHAYDAPGDQEAVRAGLQWLLAHNRNPETIRRARILSLIGDRQGDTLAGGTLFD